MLCVIACAPIIQQTTTACGQFQRLIQFSVHQQARIEDDVRAMKFQLQPPVKTNLQSLLLTSSIGFSVFRRFDIVQSLCLCGASVHQAHGIVELIWEIRVYYWFNNETRL